eukprot:TRINITY_DN36184_c0_g1_i1.p1 TRINITY_DN36184_c0_g1~~TRINITY_DN36184_c0_g1_i1.p1  ORF type:complete len:612 (+),score=88.01 TRINITY_DN36184_c0_g1_i1:104-1939(+)
MLTLLTTLLALVPWLSKCERPVVGDHDARPAVNVDIEVKVHTQTPAQKPPPPSLCDRDIVEETCRRLNQGSQDYFRTSADTELTIVHAAELAEQFMVSRRSIVNFFEAVGVINEEQNEAALELGAFAVKCQDLCTKTIQSFPPENVPPSSDVACYKLRGMVKPVCDIDVADAALASMKFGEGLADRAQAALGENLRGAGTGSQRVKMIKGSHVFETSARPAHVPVRSEDDARELLAQLEAQQYPNRTIGQLKLAVANTFRVYPIVNIGMRAEAVNASVQPALLELANTAWSKNSHTHFVRTAPSSMSSEMCEGMNKAECSRIASCVWKWTGSWRTSCKVVQAVDSTSAASTTCAGMKQPECEASPSCGWKWSGNWRTSCEAITECIDKDVTGYVYEDGSVMTCSVLVQWCAEKDIQDSCPKTCGLSCPPEQIDNWESEAVKVAVKAQAYVSKALRRMAGQEVPEIVVRWFGNNKQSTRSGLRSVLMRLNDVLSNVDYVSPGSECLFTTYAYVHKYPPYNKNRRGQYIFYLCQRYMNAPDYEKIETLLHEASHHEPMVLDDVCLSGSEENGDCVFAYGREACLKMARNSPAKSQRNADTLSFFINDAATGAS